MLAKRKLPKSNLTVRVLINFSILKFSRDIESDTMQLEAKPTDTPNFIIKEVMTTLFLKFDKKLLINKSDSMMYMLRVGEKEDFMAGDDYLFCYEEYYQAFQLRRGLNLKLDERPRSDVCDLTLPMMFNHSWNRFESEVGQRPMVGKEFNNVVLWHFPTGFNLSDLRQNSRNGREGDMNMNALNKFLQMTSYYNPTQLKNVFLSNEIRNPLMIKFLKITEIISLFDKDDFVKDTLEKKRFAPLFPVKNKDILDDRPPSEGQNFKASKSNSTDFLKSIMKDYDLVKTSRPIPLLFFINVRLFHGMILLDTSQNILLPVKNEIEMEHDFIFKNFTVEQLPLESRIVFEISALYNNSYLKKLALSSVALFDCNGFLRQGRRVNVSQSRNWLFGK